MDKYFLIIGIMIIIIFTLLISNYIKMNQFNAPLYYDTQTTTLIPSQGKCQKNIAINTNNVLTNNSQITSSKNSDTLVMYYTDWCGISQQFKPIWNRFCKENKTGVTTSEVNCEKDDNKCKLMKIRGFPTVIFHKSNGENIEFNAPRTVQNLENFIRQNRS